METRSIGSLTVSVVGVGCNNFGRRIDAQATAAVVHAALDAGINFFDTANTYGHARSEEYLGRALRGRRDAAVIATKFGMELPGQPAGGSPALMRKAIEDSLRRLGVDVIDLYQLHQPDPDVPIAETLGAMNELVTEGKVREIGCSNFSAPMLREADDAASSLPARFVSVQNELSLIHRADAADGLAEAERLNIAYLPFYPVASGLLTGKYRQGRPLPNDVRLREGGHYDTFLAEENLDLVERLIAFGSQNDRTILELAFQWLLAKRAVASVIAGARSVEQVRANAQAGQRGLSAAQLSALEQVLAPTAS